MNTKATVYYNNSTGRKDWIQLSSTYSFTGYSDGTFSFSTSKGSSSVKQFNLIIVSKYIY